MNDNLSYGSKKLPKGTSDYKEIVDSNMLYFDKTLLVRDLINDSSKVILFTRPRRFGKTLNMSMFRYFFEKTNENKEYLFKDRLIWQQGQEYLSHFGKYPVIFLTFKDIKQSNFEGMMNSVKNEISTLFKTLQRKDENFFNSLSSADKNLYTSLCNRSGSYEDYEYSLNFLSLMLSVYYDEKVIILIDEYDTPLNSAHVCGFEKEALKFMRNFLSGGLKDNVNLYKGILTGINRIGKENIFSGLNILSVYSVFDSKYAQYFGLTKEEVLKGLEYVDFEYTEEMRKWYNGYNIGGIDLYNPWSIINYLDTGELKPYWVNTASNDLIVECVQKSDTEFKDNIMKLMSGEYIEVSIEKEMTFDRMDVSGNIYGLFVNSGYLTLNDAFSPNGIRYNIRIPNEEIKTEFNSIVSKSANTTYGQLLDMLAHLRNGEEKYFKDNYTNIVKSTLSYYDIKENAYHMFMLGLCVGLKEDYYVKSNLESGDGRSDIICLPKNKNLPGIVMEFKASLDEKEIIETSKLTALAKKAIAQIKEKSYDVDFNINGQNVILLGIGHHKKQCEVVMETVNYK